MSAAPSIPETSATAEAAQAGLLYERYSSRILGFCRKRLANLEEAEDAVQHTFLNAYRSLRTGVVPRSEAAWLFKIAENVCRERRRSAWRRSRIEVVSDDGDVDGSAPSPEQPQEELAGLADALAELTPNQRRAILMREWQGLSYKEIAGELELTEAAIETLLFRARRSLAKKLDRSRGRMWGWLDLGSALAWGKSLLGGTALKVAAATAVVAAGITAGTPSLRHEILGGSAPRQPLTAQQPLGQPENAGTSNVAAAVLPAPAARSEPAPRSARGARALSRPGRTTAPSATPTVGSGSSTSGPAPTSRPVPSAPVPSTEPVTAPAKTVIDPVTSVTEPVTELVEQVPLPALPPVPPVQVPPAPPVKLPDVPSAVGQILPELPKLP